MLQETDIEPVTGVSQRKVKVWGYEIPCYAKGQFVVMKIGVHPKRVRLKLFCKLDIRFDKDNLYIVADNGGRAVEYADKEEIIERIMIKC